MKLILLAVFGSALMLVADGRPSREDEQNRTTGTSTSTSTTPATGTPATAVEGRARGEKNFLSGLARNQTALMMLTSLFEPLDSDVFGTPMTTSPPSKGHKGTHNTRRETTGGIAFPTSPPKIRTSNRLSCGANNNFCENVDNYPMNDVNILLTRGVEKYKEYFESPSEIPIADPEIGSRSGINPQLCRSVTKWITPQTGKNVHGDIKFIAKNETYQQAIVVEQCENVGRPCDFIDYFPPHLEARCVQKYVTRRLVTLNKERKGLETDKFQVPSCCSCELREKQPGRPNLP